MKVYPSSEIIKPQSDLLRLLKFFPKPDENGPWIAGGSIWKSMESESLGDADVDLFFASPQQLEVYFRILRSLPHCNRVLSEKFNDFNITFNYRVYEKGYTKIFPIQLIHFKTFPNVQELIGSFDFTACQFAYDGKYVYTGEDSLDHLRERKIVFNQVRDVLATKLHLKKYTQKGFTISAEEQKKYDDLLAEYKAKGVTPKTKSIWRNYYDEDIPVRSTITAAPLPSRGGDLVECSPSVTSADMDEILSILSTTPLSA